MEQALVFQLFQACSPKPHPPATTHLVLAGAAQRLGLSPPSRLLTLGLHMSKPCPVSTSPVVGRQWPSKDVRVLISGTYDCAFYMAGEDFADGEIVLDYLSGFPVTTRVLIRGRQDGESQRGDVTMEMEVGGMHVGGGRGRKPRKAGGLWKLEKVGKQIRPRHLQK